MQLPRPIHDARPYPDRLRGGGAGARGRRPRHIGGERSDDRRQRRLHPHRRHDLERAGRDAERAVADRRAGDDVQRGLRLVPALLPVEGDDAERAVHAQPRRAGQLPAERELVQVPRARVQRPAGLAPGRRLLQRPHRQVHERLLDRGRQPPRPAGVGRVVREDLRGRALLRLQPDREDGADRDAAVHLLRRPAERLPDRCLRRSRRRLRPGQRGLARAVLAQPLVQLSARALRSGAARPLPPRRYAAAEAARVQREGHQRQAEVASPAGQAAAAEEADQGDRQRAAPAAGAAALGRSGGRGADRSPEEQGHPRRHLHHLRLRQRVLPRRAPDRERQVPAL